MEKSGTENRSISHEQEISNLIVSYAYANDDGDIKKLGEIFQEARFSLEDIVASGRAEVEAVASRIIQIADDGRSQNTHEIQNIMITISDGGIMAQARSYWTLYRTLKGAPRIAVLSGRYKDSFLYESNRWVFKERVANILWKLDDSE